LVALNNIDWTAPNGVVTNRCGENQLELSFTLEHGMATSQLFNIYIGHVANLHIVTGVFINSTPIAPTPQVFPSTTVVGYDSGLTFEVAVPPSNGSVPGKTDVVITYEVFGNSCIGCQVQRIFVFDSQNIEECHDVTSEIIPFYLTGDDFIFDYLIVEEPNNILSTTSLFNCSQPTLGCSGTGDYQIEDDLIIDRDIVFNANANLDENITLLDDIAISVEQSSVAYFENYLLNTCDGKWEGITVEAGSTLEMSNCVVTDANAAIVLEGGATLILDNVTFRNCDVAIISNGDNLLDIQNCIFENCTNGIQINGDPTSVIVSRNIFDGCSSRCITIRNNTSRVNIFPEVGSENVFRNSNEGIGVFNGSAHIQHNIFENIRKSIRIDGSKDMKSIIRRNQIGFNQVGIEVVGSNFHADYNDIGTASGNYGHHAVDVVFSEDYQIEFNNIDAEETGVYTFVSYGEVHENIIGMNSAPAMGVDRFFGGDDVLDNIIHARYTPVRGNGTEGDLIKNNTMTSLKEGVIVIGGSTDSTIEENDIDVPRNGVLLINSLGNNINCNSIAAGGDAIEVNQNSDEQIITDNILNGAHNDVLIQSVIGRQEHHGNIFDGEYITAEGDALNNIDLSRFVIDDDPDPMVDQYDPEFPNPAELKNYDEFTGNYGSCSLIGSPIGKKFKDPEYACNYLQRIESYKTTNPKFYWNAMYHMMRFYLLTIPSETWPICITMKWNESLPCGLKDLVIKETDLKRSLSSESENNYENTETIVETQLSELQEEVCTAELQTLWKDAYLFILKKIKGDTLIESEKNRLDEIARQCATEFGDAVHWARALAAEYNDTNYTQYDSTCENNIEPRRAENQRVQSITYSISPNPAHEFIRINSSSDGYHNLDIYNTEGKRMDNIQYVGHYIEYNISELTNGIYYIKDDINSEIIKFIKL